MLAIFLYPSIAVAPPEVAAVIYSTAAKLTALIPPSTSRREALAAVNGVSFDRCIASTV
jgi:hypothetical protein